MAFEFKRNIIDEKPPGCRYPMAAVADLTGNGKTDLIVGSHHYPPREYKQGDDHLFWYEAPDWKRHIIDDGQFHLGLTAFDITGNGLADIVAAHDCHPALYWYENTGKDGAERFKRHLVEDNWWKFCHDLTFGDITGNGKPDLVASSPAAYVCYYTIPDDPTQPWQRHSVQGFFPTEGLCVYDFDKDGKNDIIAGNWSFKNPGPDPEFWPPWQQVPLAPDFRDKCRVAVIRFKDGREGVVVCEAEYVDGRCSWFEYDGTDRDQPWKEHPIGTDIYFGHSLTVADIDKDGEPEIFVGEMFHGGYGAKEKADAELMIFKLNEGDTWEKHVISTGVGTHEAHLCDVMGDGRYHVLGKEWRKKHIDWWEPR